MFITTLNSKEGIQYLEFPEREDLFYKMLAEKMIVMGVPNAVKVSSPIGSATYTLSKRSGTLLIQEGMNQLVFPKEQVCKKYQTIYLTCVNGELNNYKFYKLETNSSGVLATYGRIGAAKGELFGERTYQYPAHMFWMKYYEKISKGYTDKTSFYIIAADDTIRDVQRIEQKEKKLDNPAARNLYDKLVLFAKQVIEKTCSSIFVSQPMIEESKRLLHILYQTRNIEDFNLALIDLLAVCPRKVWAVNALLASSEEDFVSIVQREEDLIAAMEAMVRPQSPKEIKADNNDRFAHMDINVCEANGEDSKKVLRLLDCSFHEKIKNIYRVTSKPHQERFLKYIKENDIKEIKSLWHGSRNENWLSIIKNGLLLNPNAIITGKMFGDGIYFAPGSTKSWNYTSFRGSYWANGTSATAFMGLYETAYGNQLDVTAPSSYSKHSIKGKNCVHAHAGQFLRNDEIVFYDESAVLLTYLVEFEQK